MSYNYCVHFIQGAEHLDIIRDTFDQTLFTPDKGEWLVGNYSEPQSDRIYVPEISLVQKLSERAKAEIACIVPPRPRRVRQYDAETTTQTFMAGNYTKITERGYGQHQCFVIHPCLFHSVASIAHRSGFAFS